MAKSIVTIATFCDAAEARLAKGRLEEEGLSAYLLDESMAGTFGRIGNALGGVRLQVATGDADRARATGRS